MVCIAGIASGIRAADDSASGDRVIDVGDQRQLFVERALVGELRGAVLRLHHPVPQEISQSSNPWDLGNDSSVGSTFRDGGIYRRYYRPGWIKIDPDAPTPEVDEHGVMCYEESDDGIHWRQPNLGICEFHGSKSNNIVFIGGKADGFAAIYPMPSVFRDENPAATPDARYKSLFWSNSPKGIVPYKSADGLHWTPMANKRLSLDHLGKSVQVAFWDKIRKEYRLFYRTHIKVAPAASVEAEERGIDPPKGFRRDIRTTTSKDFLEWAKSEPLQYVDSPEVELYTIATVPYYRAPQIYVGFPAHYVERSWSDSLRALPDARNREMRARVSPRFGTAISEAQIMASRDGVTFYRWNEAFLRPGIERPGTWNYGHAFIAWAPVETKSALEGAPNELSFYAAESAWVSDIRTVRRYTLRLDGFVSVSAPMSGGELVTTPLRFAGRRLCLNFSTSAAGGIQIEIDDLSGKPLPGFALDDCPPIFGDAIDRTVRWNGTGDLGAIAGRPVRLRFRLADADLYAFQFKP